MPSLEIGRLMFRVDGELWNCYWTMGADKDKVYLGSIKMNLVANRKIKKKFMRLMQDAFAEMAGEVIGQKPTVFKERPAPESERTRS